MTHSHPVSPLQALAAKWHVISVIVLAFARLMRRYEDGARPGTREAAAQLELAARSAQIMLAYELAETLEAHAPRSPEDEHALAFLRWLTAGFLVMAYVAGNIRARAPGARQCLDLVGCSERSEVHQFGGALGLSLAEVHFTLHDFARDYFDSG